MSPSPKGKEGKTFLAFAIGGYPCFMGIRVTQIYVWG